MVRQKISKTNALVVFHQMKESNEIKGESTFYMRNKIHKGDDEYFSFLDVKRHGKYNTPKKHGHLVTTNSQARISILRIMGKCFVSWGYLGRPECLKC